MPLICANEVKTSPINVAVKTGAAATAPGPVAAAEACALAIAFESPLVLSPYLPL